jgi:hypothetical protein
MMVKGLLSSTPINKTDLQARFSSSSAMTDRILLENGLSSGDWTFPRIRSNMSIR